MNPVGKPGKTGALIPVEQALQQLLDMAAAAPIREQHALPLADCDGRVLAQDLVSTLDLPPWPNSAMDGYALRVADWNGEPLGRHGPERPHAPLRLRRLRRRPAPGSIS